MKEQLKDIKLLVLDFDGVFTNNKVFVLEDGTEAVLCDRSDGLGITNLQEHTDIHIAVVSKERNPVVQARCTKLKLECHQAIDNKELKLREIAVDRKVEFENIAFIGNDINDLECIRLAGVGAVVADAWDSVKPEADIILSRNGGDGAIREFCDMLLDNRNQD